MTCNNSNCLDSGSFLSDMFKPWVLINGVNIPVAPGSLLPTTLRSIRPTNDGSIPLWHVAIVFPELPPWLLGPLPLCYE